MHLQRATRLSIPRALSRPVSMSSAIPSDVKMFLDDYPGNRDDTSLSANLEFYSNRRRCQPDNVLIREIHERYEPSYMSVSFAK